MPLVAEDKKTLFTKGSLKSLKGLPSLKLAPIATINPNLLRRHTILHVPFRTLLDLLKFHYLKISSIY